jgi:hypothetical protein
LALTLFARRPPAAAPAGKKFLTDLIDLPLFYTEGYGTLVAEFLSIVDEQRLSVVVRTQLRMERENANMYGRLLSIMAVQEALGNGWCPDPADAPLYKGHCFFEALRSFPVTAFVHARVLSPSASLLQLARALVSSLPRPVHGLLARMLAWNPGKRPTCLDCLCDPWFRELFGQGPTPAPLMGEVYTAHARPPVHRDVFSAAAKRGLSAVDLRRLEIHEHVMGAEQERLRRSVLGSPLVTTQAGVAEMVRQSFVG